MICANHPIDYQLIHDAARAPYAISSDISSRNLVGASCLGKREPPAIPLYLDSRTKNSIPVFITH
jgi:hypothetical protein